MPTPSTVSARWSAGLASNTLRRGRAGGARAAGPPAGRRCYNEATHRGQALLTTLGRERCNESEPRSPAAIERYQIRERPGPARRTRRGAERPQESAGRVGAGGSVVSRRCRDRSLRRKAIPPNGRARATNRRRRRERGNRSRLPRSERRSRSGTQAPQRRFRPFGLEEFRREPASGRCGVSPLEWGARDPGLARGERPFPGQGKYKGLAPMVRKFSRELRWRRECQKILPPLPALRSILHPQSALARSSVLLSQTRVRESQSSRGARKVGV